MLENVRSLHNGPTPSGRFLNTVYRPGEPAGDTELAALSEVLGRLDAEAARTLGQFYRQCRALEFGWEHLQVGKLDVGGARIVDIDQLTAGLRAMPDDYIPFDFPEDDVVVIRHEAGRLRLYFSEADAAEEFVPLSLDVPRYFRLLDECRGLFPWQKATMGGNVQDEFLLDLERLFPSADRSLF
ncbi:MAG: hypothetical protein EOP20_02300 [Hyphomicrobiales bacterium]|nr:MAG: hypothetical protein EOP20_02300 [Hyphomicrobiales bacterium]